MKDNISSAVIFPKLRGLLESDITTLKNLNQNHSKEEDSYGMVDSLIDAKKKILSLFPANPEGLGGVSSPPQRLSIVGYESKRMPEISNLASMLYEIESDQMKFVKENLSDEGMPEELKSKLEKILEMYADITEQLGRSKKTGQDNMIRI